MKPTLKLGEAYRAKKLAKEQRKALGAAWINAARKGDVEKIARMLGQIDPNFRDDAGRTALMHAAHFGQFEAVAALLPHADPRALSIGDESALLIAAGMGHLNIVELLLPVSDPLQWDVDGDTPLMMAVQSGYLRIAKALLPVSDASAVNNEGHCALSLAILHFDKSNDIVDLLIPATAPCPECMFESMHTAVFFEDEPTCWKLLAYCGEIQADKNGKTHLMCAAAHGDMIFVEMLLPVSDPLAAEFEKGWTAVDFAAHYGYKEVAERIKAHALSRVEKEQLGACLASPSLPGAAIKRRTL